MAKVLFMAHDIAIMEEDDGSALFVRIVDQDGDEVRQSPQDIYFLAATLTRWLRERGHPFPGGFV